MAGDPLGKGESQHPRTGNAVLTTLNVSGKKVSTPLWINQFSTGLNIQTDSAQLRDKLSHRPVRFSERFLQFTTIWNVADRPKYVKLGEAIANHWIRNMNEGQSTPMTLHYFGANKTWRGFIENWDIAYAITDVLLSYTFRMRILMTQTKKDTMVTLEGHGPFMPKPEGYAATAASARQVGDGWYSKSDYNKMIRDQIKLFKKEQDNAASITLDDGTVITQPYFGW